MGEQYETESGKTTAELLALQLALESLSNFLEYSGVPESRREAVSTVIRHLVGPECSPLGFESAIASPFACIDALSELMLLERIMESRQIPVARRGEIAEMIKYFTSPAFEALGGGKPGTAKPVIEALRKATTAFNAKTPEPEQPTRQPEPTIQPIEDDEFLKRAIDFLAPHVLKLAPEAQHELRGKAEAMLGELSRDHIFQLQRLLAKETLTWDNLAILDHATRIVVLKIHYITLTPWSHIGKKERTPENFNKWLDNNMSDRRELKLVIADLLSIDKPAYQKFGNWKIAGIIQSPTTFGFLDGQRLQPSDAMLKEEELLIKKLEHKTPSRAGESAHLNR